MLGPKTRAILCEDVQVHLTWTTEDINYWLNINKENIRNEVNQVQPGSWTETRERLILQESSISEAEDPPE